MNNEIIISNISPQDIIIDGGGSTIGITTVYVNDVDVTVGSAAYVVVPTKLSELQNNVGFITSAQEQDPTVPYYVKQITVSDINNWNSKQDELVSGSNIKTINGESILGEGNLVVDSSYTAGTGISISDENVISNTITSYDDLTDLPTIPTAVSELTNDSDFVSSSVLSPVAFSGDYDDLVDKPTIPTSTSDLDNDSGFITNRVDDLINYYTRDFLYGLLPKVSDEDTNINLSGTYASKLKLDLNSTTLEQTTTTGKQLFNASLINGTENIVVEDNGQTIKLPIKTSGNGFTGLGIKLSVLCPTLSEGDTVYLYFNRNLGTTYNNFIYLNGVSQTWNNGSSKTITQQMLDGNVSLYANRFDDGETTQCILTNFRIVRNTSDGWEEYTGGVSTPNPNYPQAIHVITDDNTITIANDDNTESQSYSIDLGTIEYCKIGTYADRIFRNVEGDPDYDSGRTGTWYLKKNIGKVVLDGTEPNWYKTDDTSASVFVLPSYFTDRDTGQSGLSLSNYFKYQFANSEGKFYFSSATNIALCMAITYDLASFKTWIGSNNVEIYYILATPTYTEITGELEDQLEEIYQNAMSYTGQTNISQVNDDLPFTISATTLKDISNL